jgi:hypothetical protein
MYQTRRGRPSSAAASRSRATGASASRSLAGRKQHTRNQSDEPNNDILHSHSSLDSTSAMTQYEWEEELARISRRVRRKARPRSGTT